MNNKQQIVFLVGIGIMVLMGLIPPWHYPAIPGLWAGQSGSYKFLFSRPGEYGGTHVDIIRLFIQWIVVAIATAGVMWVVKKDDNGRSQKGE